MHIEKLNGKKWWNMTPLNYNFFNTCYWDVRCISLYEFQNYLPTLWSVALPRLCLLRKKAMEEDHNWRSIFLPFLFKTNFTLSFSFIDTSLEKQLSWLLSVYPFSSHQMLEIWRKSHVCQAVAHPDTCDVMWCDLHCSQVNPLLIPDTHPCPRSTTAHYSNAAEIKHYLHSTAVKCNHLCLQYSPPSHRLFFCHVFQKKILRLWLFSGL